MHALPAHPNLHLWDITRCPPDWRVDSRHDPYHRLYWVHAGLVRYQDAAGGFPLEAGKVYLFPAHAAYRMTQDPADPLVCLWFHFSLDRTLPDAPQVFEPAPESPAALLLEALEAMVSNREEEAVVGCTLEALLLCLCGSLLLSTDPSDRLSPVLRHIHARYAANPSNAELADIAGYNVRYFIRLFHGRYGRTPQEYLADYRCFQAERMLLGGMQVQQAAQAAGYGDAKAFSRFFKKRYGFAPATYRRRLLP